MQKKRKRLPRREDFESDFVVAAAAAVVVVVDEVQLYLQSFHFPSSSGKTVIVRNLETLLTYHQDLHHFLFEVLVPPYQ